MPTHVPTSPELWVAPATEADLCDAFEAGRATDPHAQIAPDSGAASARLFTALYAELHRLARSQLARHGAGLSLGTTTLLHEAYLVLRKRDADSFSDKGRFMAYAARVMRSVIIDWVRNRRADKRGGKLRATTLSDQIAVDVEDDEQLQRISNALDELAQLEPELAHIVDLKFFCGLTFSEIAVLRSVSERTVGRKWEKARVYLFRALELD